MAYNKYRRDWTEHTTSKKSWATMFAGGWGEKVYVSPDGKVHAKGFIDTNDSLELYADGNDVKCKFTSADGMLIVSTLDSHTEFKHVTTMLEPLLGTFQNFRKPIHTYDTKDLPLPHRKYSLLSRRTKEDILNLTSSMTEARNFHFHFERNGVRHVEPYVEGVWLGPYNHDVYINPIETTHSASDLIVIKSGWVAEHPETPAQFDVESVTWTTGVSGHVYVETRSKPEHIYGPFGGMPAQGIADAQALFKFKYHENVLLGESLGTKLETTGEIVGVMKNGVFIYSPDCPFSYGDSGYWNENLVVSDRNKIDPCGGMLQEYEGIPRKEGYLYRGMPRCLYSLGAEEVTNSHAPIVGYARDGFPIYGPHAYDSPNDSGSAIRRMETSYRLKQVSARIHPEGNGPSFTSLDPEGMSYDSGYFIEDYEFANGLGDLDEHNGRTGITPEYPNGTYAYFATIDEHSNPEYPYVVGPSYYGNLHDISVQGYRGTVTEAPLYIREMNSEASNRAFLPPEIYTWNLYSDDHRLRGELGKETMIYVSPHIVKQTNGVFLKTGYEQYLNSTGEWDYGDHTGHGAATYSGNRRMAVGDGDFLVYNSEYTYPTSENMRFYMWNSFSGGMPFTYHDVDTATVINSFTPLSITGTSFYSMYSGHKRVSGKIDSRQWDGKIPAGTPIKIETWSFNGFTNGFAGGLGIKPCVPHPLTSGTVITISALVTGVGETEDEAYLDARELCQKELLKRNNVLLVLSGVKNENRKMKNWKRLLQGGVQQGGNGVYN
jgi:hypothetical protein